MGRLLRTGPDRHRSRRPPRPSRGRGTRTRGSACSPGPSELWSSTGSTAVSSSSGEICVDSTNSSTIGGGFWPKGTADQYVFNSGIQVAGLIGPDANPEWAGDTTGAQFFSPRGDNVGEEFRPIFNSSNPDDVANWPEAAKVPQGDASEELFNPLLRGRVSASQGDVWFLSWEGNPAFSAGREHPLGVLVEQRGLGCNFPAGNEDILYFIYTFYNVTSSDPAAYAAVRPGMREILVEAGDALPEPQRGALRHRHSGRRLHHHQPVRRLRRGHGRGRGRGQLRVGERAVLAGLHLRAHLRAGGRLDLRSQHLLSAVLRRLRLRGREVPEEPGRSGHAARRWGSRSSATPSTAAPSTTRRTSPSCTAISPTTSAWPRATPPATPATRGSPDLLHQQRPGRRHAVLPVLRSAGAGAGRSSAPSWWPTSSRRRCRSAPASAPAPATSSRAIRPGSAIPSDCQRGRQRRSTRSPASPASAARRRDGTVVQDSITTVPGSLLGKALVAQDVFDNRFLLPFAPGLARLLPDSRATTR